MPNTITDQKQLVDHLLQIRQTGYAFDDEEHEPGVRCMAAPIRLSESIIAVIGISGPAVRITDVHIEPLSHVLVTAAEQLSLALMAGFQPAK